PSSFAGQCAQCWVRHSTLIHGALGAPLYTRLCKLFSWGRLTRRPECDFLSLRLPLSISLSLSLSLSLSPSPSLSLSLSLYLSLSLSLSPSPPLSLSLSISLSLSPSPSLWWWLCQEAGVQLPIS